MNAETDTVIYVAYPGTADTRFDRDYYVAHHMPLVTESWTPYGLKSGTAFFPPEQGTGTIAMCELRFRDADAFQTALNAPETPAVMADIAQFTDAQPGLFRAVAP